MGSTTVHRSLNHLMIDAIRLNVIRFAGLIANAIIAGLAVPAMTSPRGADGPTILLAESPTSAAVVVVLVFAVMTLVGGAVGRATNAAVGMFTLGAGVFSLTWQLTTAEELIWSASMGMPVVIESVLWGVLTLGGAWVIFRIAGPLKDIQPLESGKPASWIMSNEALMSAGCAAAVIPAVWLIAQAPMKGQVVGAVFVGGLLAGLVGRLISPNVQPVMLFAAPCVFGAIGHAIGGFMSPSPIDEAFIAGELSHLNLPMPIDFAAGGIMGVAVGLGWAKSFLHHEE